MRLNIKTKMYLEDMLRISKMAPFLIIATIAISYLISEFTNKSFNTVIWYSSMVLVGVGVVFLLEKSRYSLITGLSGTIVLIAALTVWSAEPVPLGADEKLEDFEYVYKLMTENYPHLQSNERVHGLNWAEEKDRFRNNIEDTSNYEFMAEINFMLRELNNAQTHILDRNFFVRAYSTYVNTEFDVQNNPWADAISGENTAQWYDLVEEDLDIEYFTPYLSDFNKAFRISKIIPDEVAYLKIIRMDGNRIDMDGEEIRDFFGEIKDYERLIIDIRGNRGGSDLYWMNNVIAPLISQQVSIDNYFFIRGSYTKPFYDARGIDLQPVSNLSEEVTSNFPKEVKSEFDYYGIRNLTIDPVDPIDFKGEIYLLMDDRVYYSAENFASFVKDSGFATIVGKPTAGEGLSFEPVMFSLPNSGIVGRYRGELVVGGDGSVVAEGIKPDIGLLNTADKFPILDVDEAVQYIINLE